MATIRPAAAHDLARIEEIYDTIHTAEEAGKVSIGWVRGVYPTRATAQAGLDAGDLFVLAVGDEDLIKIHFHTNTPWKVLEYCAGLGDIHDVVIENMERQENGLHG